MDQDKDGVINIDDLRDVYISLGHCLNPYRGVIVFEGSSVLKFFFFCNKFLPKKKNCDRIRLFGDRLHLTRYLITVICTILGKQIKDEDLQLMVNMAPGEISFKMMLTMFGEKLSGNII